MRQNSFAELKIQVNQFLQIHCCGRNRAIRAKDLAFKFEIDIRAINDIVRSLRMGGILIGSSKDKPCGYYIPITEDEIKGYLNTYKSELFDMLIVYNRQRRAQKTFLDNLRTKDLFQYKDTPNGQRELILA